MLYTENEIKHHNLLSPNSRKLSEPSCTPKIQREILAEVLVFDQLMNFYTLTVWQNSPFELPIIQWLGKYSHSLEKYSHNSKKYSQSLAK